MSTFPRDAPTRAELLNGRLTWSAQSTWHMRAVWELQRALEAHTPEVFEVVHRMAIRLSEWTAPEPDLSIMHASVFDLEESVLSPSHVVLVAEIISPESEERDREDKPMMYAAMGIPTFWLVERGPDLAPIVHEHRLYAGGYRLMNTHIGQLRTDIPFAMDLRLDPPKL